MSHSASLRPGATRAEVEARLSALEMGVYQTLHGVVGRCEEAAARAEALGDTALAIRARLLATDALSRKGLAAAARDEQIALHRRASPWPTLARRAAMVLASTCDRLGLRLESMRWVEASISADPQADTPMWHAEALMVAALFVSNHGGEDHTLVERALAAVRAAGHPVLLSVTAANFAEVAAEAGQLVHASHHADEAEATMKRHPECEAALTWESVARARLACGELPAARQAMRSALRVEEALGCCDVNGDPWLSYAEILLASAAPEAALEMLRHPRRALQQVRSSSTALRELQVRARALAAQAQWEPAYHCLEQYLAGYQRACSLEAERAAAESRATVVADDARREARRFEQLAMTDALTGLPNRRHAERWLAEQAAREGGWLGLAIADLDHFKAINDRHTHDVGDLVLQCFGTLLSDEVQGAGLLVARLGGEEFLLAFASGTAAGAHAICERVARRLREHRFDALPPGQRVTVSIGLAHAPCPAAVQALMRAADLALYEAKRGGRDRVELASGVGF